MREVYLDNSATTRICESALRAYIEASEEHWGNPSSRHGRGKDAEDLTEGVRRDVRASVGARDGAVIFTAGGTEANNLAIFGRAHAKPRYRRGAKILTTAGEHSSVSQPLTALSAEGYHIVEIPTVGGVLNMDVLTAEMTPDVILITMMLVNNESGALYDIAAVSRLMHTKCPEAILHIDATQAYGKVPFTAASVGADMMTLSSHKIEGPKGVGALWVAAPVLTTRGLSAIVLGGGQEGGLRSGTENVPGIAAFGAAVREKSRLRDARSAEMTALRRYLIDSVSSTPGLAEVKLNLPPVAAPHIVSITMPQLKSETVLNFLSARGIYVSSGSACSSHDAHLSSAMLAYGLTAAEADTTIRVSFGAHNTREDIDTLLSALEEAVRTLIRIRR